MTTVYRVFKTTMGWCGIVGNSHGILRIVLPTSSRHTVEKLLRREWPGVRRDHSVLASAERQVKEYFAGRRKNFVLPLFLPGHTSFERAVYAVVRRIPYGKTVSYGRIARQIGKPRAARAVGQALSRNPIPLLIPCHRVLASDGRLCGFTAEGGLVLKQKLLELEGSKSVAKSPKKYGASHGL